MVLRTPLKCKRVPILYRIVISIPAAIVASFAALGDAAQQLVAPAAQDGKKCAGDAREQAVVRIEDAEPDFDG